MDILQIRRTLSTQHLSDHRRVAGDRLDEQQEQSNTLRKIHHKTVEAIHRTISVLVVDLRPTGNFDRDGIHATVRNRLSPQTAPIVDLPEVNL